MDDPNTKTLSKQQYRAEVTNACHHFQRGQLNNKMRSKEGQIMKKCQKISKDLYERKPYFDNKMPSQVRSFFSTRVSMLPLTGNFRQDRRFARTNWLCRCGKEREEEHHLTDSCSLYKDIREKLSSLEEDNQLVADTKKEGQDG